MEEREKEEEARELAIGDRNQSDVSLSRDPKHNYSTVADVGSNVTKRPTFLSGALAETKLEAIAWEEHEVPLVNSSSHQMSKLGVF